MSEGADGASREALYNKYRPRRFSEIIGQDYTKVGIRKAISEGSLKHAYLLSGDRGCGKTTTARIIAAAVNCENVQGGEPCGQCDICEATFAGTFTGVVTELNAADNRGIGDIRELISIMDLGVAYRRKVFIIDEAHRLTADAWSALLKPIEEPPNDQTLWILATTDPQKLPQTILSRVSRLNFNLLNTGQLTEMVNSILEQEDEELDDQLIEDVVWSGHGSARDTLTALERAMMGLELDTASHLEGVLEALVTRDFPGVVLSVPMKDSEVDHGSIAEGVLAFLERAIVLQHSPDKVSDDYRFIEKAERLANKWNQAELTRAITIMSDALHSINSLGSKRATLVGSLARVLEPTGSRKLSQLQDQISELTEMVNSLVISLPASPPAWEISMNGSDWPESQEDSGEGSSVTESSDEGETRPRSRRKRPSRRVKETRVRQDRDEPSAPTDLEADLEQSWVELVDSCSTPRSKRIMEGATYSLVDGSLVVLSDGTIPQSVKRRVKETFSDLHCSFEIRGR